MRSGRRTRRRPAELEVVTELEVEARPLAHLADDHRVLIRLAVGRLRRGKVGQLGGQRVAALGDLGELGPDPLQVPRQRAHALDQLGGVLAGPLAGRDLLRGLVLSRPPALELGQQRPPAGVELEQLIERLAGAASCERLAGRARVGADCP